MNEQNKSNKLLELKKNTLIIGIATFGSKAISFILAPLYSYYLTTTEYGTMDLVTTTVSLLLPILMSDVYESVFRFTSDPNENNNKVLTNSSLIALIGTIIGALLIFPISRIYQNLPVILIIYLYIIMDGFTLIFSWYERGSGKIGVFAFSGVINSVFQLVFTFLFIVLLQYGLTGWYIGFLCAKVVTFLYLFINVRPFKVIKKQYLDKAYQKRIMNHCVPLIPTTIMWWVMNASDRYVISIFMGMAANGIYAVANKIPSLLSVFENIFYQAWQTSSINALEDKSRDKFYSEVFTNYFSILTLGVLGLLLVLKPITIRFFAHGYESAWRCTAILVVAVMFHALGGNLGTFYGTFKSTKGALITSIIGAGTNIILNLIFIPHWGIMAAATTTLIGYVVVLLYRWWDVKRFVKLTISPAFLIFWLVIIAVQFALYYVAGIVSYIIRAVIVLVALYCNKNLVLKILEH